MARCDQGYLCRVCGAEVEDITDSDLYLQYVIGWIDPETLHTVRECHLRCNQTLAQFIDDDRFQPKVIVEGEFARQNLDPQFVSERTKLINRGYARLWDIFNEDSPPAVMDYPLDEVRDHWK